MDMTNMEKLTPLEFMHAPVSFSNYYARRHNGQRKYKYYDTPDGQDIDKKLFVTTKYGLTMGTIIALMDIRIYSNPKTVFQTINRAAYIILPITGMWTTYAAVTYTVTNLRGVDSIWNAGIGGAVTGGLFGVWMKDYRLGILTAVYAGLLSTMAKNSHKLGHELFVLERLHKTNEGLRIRAQDYSLTEIGEKGWTTHA